MNNHCLKGSNGNCHRVNREDFCTIQLDDFLSDLDRWMVNEHCPDISFKILRTRINELFSEYFDNDLLVRFLVSVYDCSYISFLSIVVKNFRKRNIINNSNINYIKNYSYKDLLQSNSQKLFLSIVLQQEV